MKTFLTLALAIMLGALSLTPDASADGQFQWRPVVSAEVESVCKGTTENYVGLHEYIDGLFADGTLGPEAARDFQAALTSAVSNGSQAELDALRDRADSLGLSGENERWVDAYLDNLDILIPCVPLEGPQYVFNPGGPGTGPLPKVEKIGKFTFTWPY